MRHDFVDHRHSSCAPQYCSWLTVRLATLPHMTRDRYTYSFSFIIIIIIIIIIALDNAPDKMLHKLKSALSEKNNSEQVRLQVFRKKFILFVRSIENV